MLFVTGKGGVGKSSVAAALAMVAASTGKRTLLCEVDRRQDTAALFGLPSLDYRPARVRADLWAMSVDTESALREYLRVFVHLPAIGVGPLASTLDFVAAAAPGVKEILTVGKVAWEVREHRYDLVVVDAPSSGHVLAHLAAPESLAALVDGGLIGSQTRWMDDLLADRSVTGAVVVTVPEELAITETIELVDRIRTETRVDVAAVVANRVWPELFGPAEERVFDRVVDTMERPEVAAALLDRDGWDGRHEALAAVLSSAHLATSIRRSRSRHLRHLRDELPAMLELLYLPELFDDVGGPRSVDVLSESLAGEVL